MASWATAPPPPPRNPYSSREAATASADEIASRKSARLTAWLVAVFGRTIAFDSPRRRPENGAAHGVGCEARNEAADSRSSLVLPLHMGRCDRARGSIASHRDAHLPRRTCTVPDRVHAPHAEPPPERIENATTPASDPKRVRSTSIAYGPSSSPFPRQTAPSATRARTLRARAASAESNSASPRAIRYSRITPNITTFFDAQTRSLAALSEEKRVSTRRSCSLRSTA